MRTSEQLRAARAMVRLEQAELARQAGVSVETIKRLEGSVGQLSAQGNTLFHIQTVLEFAGIEFLNDDKLGVRFKDPKEAIMEGIAEHIRDVSMRILKSRLENEDLLALSRHEVVDMVSEAVAGLIQSTLPRLLPNK